MYVPFVSLDSVMAECEADLEAAYRRVTEKKDFILGSEVEAFENEFARYCGVKFAVGTGNGLDALVLILRGYGIGPGDEVIVPGHTFIATWLAVSAVGARLVPVDIDSENLCIDTELVRGAISERTRAVIAVHIYGLPADVDKLRDVVDDSNIKVIEDAAQAHGARYKGRRAGSLGDAAGFSFYPAKNLGALGDGGAVTTNDDSLATRVRELRNYGSAQKYVHVNLGVNSRLDELQAAFLRTKLTRLDAWNADRNRVANIYLDALAGTSLLTQSVSHSAESVWHLFTVRCARRAALMEALERAKIGCQIHYPIPPHRQEAYCADVVSTSSLPITERVSEETLSLPMWPGMPMESVTAVTEAIRRWCSM